MWPGVSIILKRYFPDALVGVPTELSGFRCSLVRAQKQVIAAGVRRRKRNVNFVLVDDVVGVVDEVDILVVVRGVAAVARTSLPAVADALATLGLGDSNDVVIDDLLRPATRLDHAHADCS